MSVGQRIAINRAQGAVVLKNPIARYERKLMSRQRTSLAIVASVVPMAVTEYQDTGYGTR